MTTPASGLFPASFVYAGPTTLNLTQIGSAQCDMGTDLTEIIPSGALDRAALMVSKADPSCKIATADLLTALGVISPTAGLNCTGGATFRYQRRADGGAFAGSTSNLTLTSTVGYLAPVQLSTSQDARQGAMLELMYWPLYNGSVQSLVANASVNFSTAPAPVFNSQYYLGPVYLGSTELPGLINVRVNFGINYKTIRSSGQVLATGGSIYSRRPSITLTFLKIDTLPSTIAACFGALLGATLSLFFARGVNFAERDDYANSTHLKIATAGGMWLPGDLGALGEDDATFSVTVQPAGSGSALAVTVGTTIP